ncbi:LOB domain-containing protein 33-like [Silene latifolia]|uniref:LOB domain-containing protein 33-like n=1 Tax=Silene latifolia TaxID=37657 RepID=UPI003D788217
MKGSSTSCGACKFLRRKCTKECVFVPYFSYDEANLHFGAVHKVFGASNVSRLILHLPEQYRSEAALSITYQALSRIRDPVYGCVAYIYALQQQVANLQEEIEVLGNHMANLGKIGSITTSNEYLGSQITSDNLVMNNNMLLTSSSQENLMNNNLQEYLSHIINNSANYEQDQHVARIQSGHGLWNTHILMNMDDHDDYVNAQRRVQEGPSYVGYLV